MAVYYNDNDPFAAEWLRNLVRDGLIAKGDVDERSIADVSADDLRGYQQCHFFAGIGGWSYALRLAGWPDDRPVWTGSCPCPPFSTAGKRLACPACHGRNLVWCPRRAGHAICADCRHAWPADARHLWPELWRLIAERQPAIVLGEQVASDDGLVWLAAVRGSLEIVGFDIGAADLPAAARGAPHLRQRLFWAAQRRRRDDGILADADGRRAGAERQQRSRQQRQQPEDNGAGDVGDAKNLRLQEQGKHILQRLGCASTKNPWADIEWLWCADGKARPTQSGLFPLADGISGRLAVGMSGAEAASNGGERVHEYNRNGALRGIGNAIVPEVAAEFIRAVMSEMDGRMEQQQSSGQLW